jgi:hypothetical protein
MPPLLRVFGTRLKKLLRAPTPFPAPTVGPLIAGLSILGIAGLTYLYGAAVMFFQLPSYDFLDKAFGGVRAWQQRGRSTLPPLPAEEAAAAKRKEGIHVDKAEKTSDGFTLYTLTEGARAALIDMRGNVVHQWRLPFRRAWPQPPHLSDPLDDDRIHWFHCYLYPNGDLLAIYHADGDTPYGYGLVKLDKHSKLLWVYADCVHHDVEVDEDGTIYTLTQQIASETPVGLEFLAAPYLTDSLVVLSAQGRELQKIPLVEAFANSPYALTLATGSKSSPGFDFSGANVDPAAPSPPWGGSLMSLDEKNDPFHANSVRVLPRSWASKFPLFKPGQVLISLRNLDTVAVLDRHTRRVVWAARGIWRLQHDAEFLENGHLLVYDNCGSPRDTRVLEYDPLTQAVPWAYNNENSLHFRVLFRGMKQRLPNGNTLIVDPDNRRLFEVTREKELVWEHFCPLPPVRVNQHFRRHAINGARRYRAEELTFLKGVAHARP